MISHWRSKSRPKRRLLSLTFGIICLLAGPTLSAGPPEHKYDGVYTGQKSLKKGTASTNCPAQYDVSVTITGETLKFTDNNVKDYTMSFHPGPNGSFGATHTGAGGSYFHYRGRIVGDIMDVDTDNRNCNYHWHLTKGNIKG